MLKIKAQVHYTVTDEHGKIIKEKRHISHSYTQAFIDVLCRQMSQGFAIVVPAKDIAGATYNLVLYENNLSAMGAITDTTLGIVVGTGNTPVAISDYKLDTKIAHGVGLDEMLYAANVFTAPVTSVNTRKFVLSRAFSNSSGAPIIVKEYGIDVAAIEVGPVAHFALAVRDIATPAITVPDASVLTLDYTILVTV